MLIADDNQIDTIDSNLQLPSLEILSLKRNRKYSNQNLLRISLILIVKFTGLNNFNRLSSILRHSVGIIKLCIEGNDFQDKIPGDFESKIVSGDESLYVCQKDVPKVIRL